MSIDLGFNPDDIRHISDLLVDEEHMGVELSEDAENSFWVKSISAKRRFKIPLRYDLRIDLDPSRAFLPTRLLLLSRSHDDPTYSTPYMTYTIRRFGGAEQHFFPVSVHRQLSSEDVGVENLWNIVEPTLRVNVDPSELNWEVNLDGIPGYDHRTKTRFNQPKDGPTSAGGPFAKSVRRSDDVTSAKLNSTRSNGSKFALIGFGVLLIIGVIWFVADRWGKG